MTRSHFAPVETQGPDIERDEDLDVEDDGVFDDGLFDDGEQEGVFEDRTSIFSTPSDPPADHHNALTTREMEARRYEDPKPPQQMTAARKVYNDRAGFAQPKRNLVAKFDAQGRPFVAYFVNGKQTEAFRVPTLEEVKLLQTKGKLVSGGIGSTEASSGIPWKKILIGAVAVVAAGGAYYIWKKRKQDTDSTTVDHVDNVSED
jgi:hypothetical protein